MRLWSIAGLAAASLGACAGANHSESPAASGAYTFRGDVSGLGSLTGQFKLDEDGRVTSLVGTCQRLVLPNARSCVVHGLHVVRDDNGAPRAGTVDISVTMFAPEPGSSQGRFQVREMHGSVIIDGD